MLEFHYTHQRLGHVQLFQSLLTASQLLWNISWMWVMRNTGVLVPVLHIRFDKHNTFWLEAGYFNTQSCSVSSQSLLPSIFHSTQGYSVLMMLDGVYNYVFFTNSASKSSTGFLFKLYILNKKSKITSLIVQISVSSLQSTSNIKSS